MSNNPKRPTPTPTAASVRPEQGIELLERQIARGRDLLSNRPLEEAEHSAWEATTRSVLLKCFGSDSDNIRDVMSASNRVTFGGESEEWCEQQRADSLQTQLTLLRSCVDQLEIDRELASKQGPTSGEEARTKKAPAAKAFVVHGHDNAIRDEVARFLDKLGIKPIILMEQPHLGQTLIEKLEQQHGAPYAVVLCTADDLGRAKDGDDLQPRPRQNVVLELGYFIGARGRKNVCVLMSEGLEMPTDIHGVGYVSIDPGGGWKLSLAKELKAAGLPVDLNRVVEA